ncbi:uracil-DNA glycosylase [Sesbania bispinosa]|nr:uracil-DNA glycosylase [Sesbania bispinosa]
MEDTVAAAMAVHREGVTRGHGHRGGGVRSRDREAALAAGRGLLCVAVRGWVETATWSSERRWPRDQEQLPLPTVHCGGAEELHGRDAQWRRCGKGTRRSAGERRRPFRPRWVPHSLAMFLSSLNFCSLLN